MIFGSVRYAAEDVGAEEEEEEELAKELDEEVDACGLEEVR